MPASAPHVAIGEAPPDSTMTALLEAEGQRDAGAVSARFAPTLPATEMAEAARVAGAMPPAAPPADGREADAPPTGPSERPAQRSDPPARRSDPPTRRSDPPTRRSDPGIARRRAPSEDLIGDLFERMHELSFMVDLVSGADYVVRVLAELIPCEGTVIHAFDLARHEFVVIRAKGPRGRDALLHRTPDSDPRIREIMRHRSLASNGAAPVRSDAFERIGIEPRAVLCGAARQGGRDLGLIELANPQGGTPFHEGEASALEYVCEQFAEFVAQRPVVLDPEVVLGQ